MREGTGNSPIPPYTWDSSGAPFHTQILLTRRFFVRFAEFATILDDMALTSEQNTPGGAPEEPFLRVLAHRTMLKAYILSIVRDSHLAEDTIQDVTLVIARSWGNFDHTQSFERWARGIAWRVAMANLRKYRRPVVELEEEVLDQVGLAVDRLGDEAALEDRKQALKQCIEQLSEPNRELIRQRYFDECSYTDIAARSGRSLGALYVAFTRLHAALARCVEEHAAT
jgi:RNA polymerase sigma-70 factor, ECF subfamily